MDNQSTDQAGDPGQVGVTYGDFALGMARPVYVPMTIQIQESHHRGAIAEAAEWPGLALRPAGEYWIDAARQIWPIRERAKLVAMIAGLGSLLPLGLILLRTRFFHLTGRAYLGALLSAFLVAWMFIS